MLVRLVKPWRRHLAGVILQRPDGYANVLIRRGLAVVQPPEKPKAATKRSRNKQ